MKSVEVVGAVIVNPENQVLCAQRAPHMAQGGLWEFPGGKIEPGEDPRATLAREIREELGCEIRVGDLVADATYAYPTVRVRLLTYYAEVIAGEPEALEHAALTWVALADLHRLDWAPADLPTVEHLIKEA